MLTKLLASAFFLILPALSFAQTAERSVTIEADATVKSVDPDTRLIVLQNSETGEEETIVAGAEVVNFDQIEEGDKVKAVYTLGVAANMAFPGEVDSMVELEGRAAEGSTPGVAAGTMVTLILTFVSFDAASSIATVTDSSGTEQMIEVETEVGREFVEQLSPGDRVALSFTEGLAVGIVEE